VIPKDKKAKFCFEPLRKGDIDKSGGGLDLTLRLLLQFDYDELEQNVRQQGDLQFQDMLGRIRVGCLNDSDVAALERRLIKDHSLSSTRAKAEYFSKMLDKETKEAKTLVLMATNEMVSNFNDAMLKVKNIKTEDILAIDTGPGIAKTKKPTVR